MSENQKKTKVFELDFKDETNKKRKSSNFVRRYRYLENEDKRKEFQQFLERNSNLKPNPLDLVNFPDSVSDLRDSSTKTKKEELIPINETNENDGSMINILDDKIDDFLEQTSFKHAKTTVKENPKFLGEDNSSSFSLLRDIKSVHKCMNYNEMFGKRDAINRAKGIIADDEFNRKFNLNV